MYNREKVGDRINFCVEEMLRRGRTYKDTRPIENQMNHLAKKLKRINLNEKIPIESEDYDD